MDFTFGIGDAINSIGNLIGSIGANRTARKNAKLEAETSRWITEQNNAAQMKLAQYQNDYNYKMWREQNEYNSPEQMAARLEKAGFNKNAFVGDMATGNTASSAPEAAVPHIDYSTIKAEKKINHLNWVADVAKNTIGFAQAVEDLKSKKIDNNIKQIQGSHMDEWWRLRSLLGWSKYYWSGAIPGDKLGRDIQQAVFNKIKYQGDLLKGNYELIPERREALKASARHSNALATLVDQSSYQFNKTVKPWIEQFGRWYTPVDSGDLIGLGKAMLLKRK